MPMARAQLCEQVAELACTRAKSPRLKSQPSTSINSQVEGTRIIECLNTINEEDVCESHLNNYDREPAGGEDAQHNAQHGRAD